MRHDGEVSLLVLVALSDASRGERLAASLAGLGGVIALVGEDMEPDHAEVAVVDDVATVKSLPPGTPVVLLSGRDSAAITRGTVAATLGADADPVLIAAAARLAAAGYRITGGTLSASARLSDEVANDPEETAASLPIHLSPREAEVLALLAEGAPNKVIARRLGISVHTVKFHVAALLVKLGAANRTDAIATAMRQGLVLV
ncbi:transcriptional regulator, LuxR family [Nitrobacter hamburgensis X14]|uniref:Transcriptional regulator, LuxR family n=1 Tax=Nitrobacter hamburgensis (strain DSM 10229 / NCIMB 13809 / X14) TaxID=323097 RepID=Q1QPG7_NITHX|nr:response regulator transcription factor [Nitrobacter hamburgensis]ABE61880.1 transcriptional regulator, LuxR family [Nitrobacter hamburgensis X14]